MRLSDAVHPRPWRDAAAAARRARVALEGFLEAVTGADREVGTDLPRAGGASAPLRAAGFF